MADEFTVKVLSVKDVPAIGSDLQFHQVTRVSIMVGTHGAFTKDFSPPNNTPEQINSWKQQKANEVKAIVG